MEKLALKEESQEISKRTREINQYFRHLKCGNGSKLTHNVIGGLNVKYVTVKVPEHKTLIQVLTV